MFLNYETKELSCRAQTQAATIQTGLTPVLASALKGQADFLVTGDKKDFAALMMKGSSPFRIMAPAEFLDMIPEIAGKQE